jgi:hypothetical protein
VTTENASVSADSSLLFYNKQIWEMSQCIDFFSYIFYSKSQSVGVESHNTGICTDINIQIYPNPANNYFLFRVTGRHDIDHFRIYDIQGRFIKQINIIEKVANWDCTDFRNRPVSSGVYFAIFKTGDRLLSKKLTYLQ